MAINETKSWQIFDGKVRELNRYLQLMDNALRIANNLCNQKKKEEISIAKALGSTELRHNQLNVPNRKNDIKRTFVFARNKLNEQALVELYSLFSDYLANVIGELTHVKPTQILSILSGTDNSVTFPDIVRFRTYDTILNEMAKRVFRSLEKEQSTKRMLDKVIKTCNLSIDEDLQNEALLYVEIRNLIVHNNTKADEKI